MSADVIRADGLAKRFGPVLALRDVSMLKEIENPHGKHGIKA